MADPAQISQKNKGKGKGKKGKGKDKGKGKGQADTVKGGKKRTADEAEAEDASGGTPKGSSASAADQEKPHLTNKEPLCCKYCKMVLMVSKLYALELTDWQGMLPATCFGCAKVHATHLVEEVVSEAVFEKACDKRWKMKSRNHKQQSRIKGVQAALATIERDPDESKRQYMKRVFRASMQLAANLFTQFEKFNPQQKVDMKEALNNFKECCDKQAADPTFVPRLNVGCILPAEASQYVSMITDTLAEYFLCRVPGTFLTFDLDQKRCVRIIGL